MGLIAAIPVQIAQRPALPLTWWVILSRFFFSSLGFTIYLMARGRKDGIGMLIWEPIVDKNFPSLFLLGYIRGIVSWPG